MFLERGDAMGIGDFAARRFIDDVKRVDGSAVLRADARQRDINILPPETRKQCVEQADAIRSLHLDEGVGGMRFVIHYDTRGKFHLVPGMMFIRASGAFY